MIKNIFGKCKIAKKSLFTLITFSLLGIFSISYSSSMLGTIETENITIASGEAIVFSYAKKIDTIFFSKDSGFTIRTLEGSVWKDVGNDISEFTPMRGYLVRNFSAGDLIINATYKNIVLAEEAVFSRVLKAGWNLVGPAFDNDDFRKVNVSDAFGSLLYSEVIDFTNNGFVENLPLNHDVLDGNYTIRTKESLSGSVVNEKLAYGVLVDSDSTLSGSQLIKTTEQTYARTDLTNAQNIILENHSTGSLTISWDKAQESLLYDTSILGYKITYGTGVMTTIEALFEGTGATIDNLFEDTMYFVSVNSVHLMDSQLYTAINAFASEFKTKGRPVMGNISDIIAYSGSLINIDISSYVTENDGDLLTYTLTGDTLPVGLLFNTGSGLLSGTPTSTGSYNLSVYATDIDGVSNIDNFNLTIEGEVPPIMGDVPDTVVFSGSLVNIDVSTYVILTNTDPILSYTLTGDTLPVGLLFNTGSGLLSGTPTSTGSYNFSVYATDNDGDSNADIFNLTVNP